MAMVKPKSQKLRLALTHLLLLGFLVMIMYPLLMVFAIRSAACCRSISPGTTGSWRSASPLLMKTAASPRRRSRCCCGCGTR